MREIFTYDLWGGRPDKAGCLYPEPDPRGHGLIKLEVITPLGRVTLVLGVIIA